LFALIRSQILDLMLHEARDQVTYHSSKPFGLLLNFFYFFIFSDLYMFLHSLSSGSNNFYFIFFLFHSFFWKFTWLIISKQVCDSSSSKRAPSNKKRFRWTQDLHDQFVKTVDHLGGAESKQFHIS